MIYLYCARWFHDIDYILLIMSCLPLGASGIVGIVSDALFMYRCMAIWIVWYVLYCMYVDGYIL